MADGGHRIYGGHVNNISYAWKYHFGSSVGYVQNSVIHCALETEQLAPSFTSVKLSIAFSVNATAS